MASEQQPLALFDRIVTPVLGFVAALVMFGLMAVTCVDVFGRYFLSMPVRGGFEITEMLLATLIFAGLPLVTLRNEHVMVDVLDALVPEWLFRLQHVMACLIAFVATAYLSWRLWIRAVSMVAAGETTAQLKFTIGYLTFAMSILMAVTALALLVLACRRPARHSAGTI